MRWSVVLGGVGLALVAGVGSAEAQRQATAGSGDRMNRMITLIEQGKPILGLNNPPYAAGGGGGGRGRGAAAAGAPTPPPPPPPDIAAAAREVVRYTLGDYVLNSYSNNSVAQYRELMKQIVA